MNAPEYYLDTNIFIRFFIRDNKKMSSDCANLMSAVRQGEVDARTSALTLAEVQWVLGSFYSFPKAQVIRALKIIAPLSESFADIPRSVDAVSLYEMHSTKFVDALIASHRCVQSGKTTVISYDKDFDKIGVKRVEPAALLH